jgi:hypothetical protein
MQMMINSGNINIQFTTSSNRLVGINKHRELTSRIWRTNLWHTVHTKFHEYLSSHSLVFKYVQTDTASWKLGWIGLGQVILG